jgi:hypothetical protein
MDVSQSTGVTLIKFRVVHACVIQKTKFLYLHIQGNFVLTEQVFIHIVASFKLHFVQSMI